MSDLTKTATLYRTAQFYAHEAHHLAQGATFFADHAYLGELYETYTEAYDALIERMLGLGVNPNLTGINAVAAAGARPLPATTESAFRTLLAMERQIVAAIETANEGATLGTQNLLQGLADESEARQYKLGRRAIS